MSRHKDPPKRVHDNKYASERPSGPTLLELSTADPTYMGRQLEKAKEQRDRLNRPPVPPTPLRNNRFPTYSDPYGISAYRMSGR